jgi:hypothetical protein
MSPKKRIGISAEDVLAINVGVTSSATHVTVNLTGDLDLDQKVIEAVRANRTVATYVVEPLFRTKRTAFVAGTLLPRNDVFQATFAALDQAIVDSQNPNFMFRYLPLNFMGGQVRSENFMQGLPFIPVDTPLGRLMQENEFNAGRLLQVIRGGRIGRPDAVLMGERLGIIAKLSQIDSGPALSEAQVGQMTLNAMQGTLPAAYLRLEPWQKLNR